MADYENLKLTINDYISTFERASEVCIDFIHDGKQPNFVLVSPKCIAIYDIIRIFDAQPVRLPNQRIYYNFTFTVDGCKYGFFIWEDFTGDKSQDDEYLLEFRKFCIETHNIADVRFYIPLRSVIGNTLQTYHRFERIFKKGSFKRLRFTINEYKSKGGTIDMKQLLSSGALQYFDFINKDINFNFANSYCTIM
jgi:hypothetical protein